MPTPDALLRRYPREMLLWLRGCPGLTETGLAVRLGVRVTIVRDWEALNSPIPAQQRG